MAARQPEPSCSEKRRGQVVTGFKELSNYPEFRPLVENVRPIIAELEKANPVWTPWSSDAFDDQGKPIFLRGGGWAVSPVYFGRQRPDQVINIDPAYKAMAVEACRALPGMYPHATQLLRRIPTVNYAAFSRLLPRSRLEPHQHYSPESLIMHMALKVPSQGSGIRVAGESLTWRKPGDMIVFNDNQEHSAWNCSGRDRVVLYVDFQQPLSGVSEFRGK
jgi:hypothetical protein